MIISIDAGRSATKLVTYPDWKTLRIPSVHAIVTKDFLANGIVRKKELITSIDGFKNGEMWIIGRAAIDRVKSNDLIEVSDTKEFLKNSIIHSLSALTEICPKNDKITIISQLTSADRKNFGNTIKKALSGTKMVNRYDSFGDLTNTYTYNIESEVYVQGLCAYFDLLFDKNGIINEELEKQTVLVVDVGHQTTDVVLVKGLAVSDVQVYNVGSGSIFFSIANDLRKKGINIAAKDLEWRFIEGRTTVLNQREGTEFNIIELMKYHADKIAQMLINNIVTQYGSETMDKVILTGGSSKLFFEQFKECWKFSTQPDDPQFSNAMGAMKWYLYGDKIKG
jgi:hypothetical protein